MRARRAAAVLAVGATILIAGCATMNEGSGNRVSGDVVTAEYLEGLENLTVHQALQQLKPMWLRSPRYSGMRVYVDGIYQGRRGILHNIQVRNVQEIEFLDSRQATMEFGTNHGSGALLIRTQR